MARDSADDITSSPSDAELLSLFHSNPDRAWHFFVNRYADLIFSQLRHLGFDYDQSMDRFVYIFEKLAENEFRRLRTVRYAGNSGDLTPWVRKVVKNLSVNWAWSEEGRKRLLKPISQLPKREQRVFELYFWRGMSPAAISEQLSMENYEESNLAGTLEALEQIITRLSEKKLWRLLSNLARTRGTVSLDEVEETGTAFDPVDAHPNPEELLIQKERDRQLAEALACLSPKERLIFQFRYEEGMAFKEIAEILHSSEHETKRLLKLALARVRQVYK